MKFEQYTESYVFNDEIVQVIDKRMFGTQYQITYIVNGKKEYVILDDIDEFDELFKISNIETFRNLKKPIKSLKTKIPKTWKIVYMIGNNIIETIKDNIHDENQAYQLAWTYRKNPVYRLGKIKVV